MFFQNGTGVLFSKTKKKLSPPSCILEILKLIA